MDFRIADTFTASLARLAGDEQKTAKTTAFDLQLNPASPGMSFHKPEHAKDKHFWSLQTCDDEVVPSQERIESVADNADLEDVYDTERHLLYVACTRARDHLLVTSVDPASEFLDDLTG